MHIAHQTISVSICLTELLLSGMGSSQKTYDSNKKLSVYLIEVKAVLFSIIFFFVLFIGSTSALDKRCIATRSL